MALTSPGVQVTVIDESFFTPAEPGTTPLIVVATAQDKSNSAGTGIASATTKANAGRAFRVTSQRELVDLFGVPFFEQTATGNPIHGGERNEYGLLAAYSFLGVSNSAFVVRADVDLAQLEGQAAAPGSNPRDGTWWVDTQATVWGIQEWNAAARAEGGQRFTTKTPVVLTNDDIARVESGTGAPKESVGSIGDYAVVYLTGGEYYAEIYYKSPGNGDIPAGSWVLVGSDDWTASNPTVRGNAVGTIAAGSFEINTIPVQISSEDDVQDIVDTINGLELQVFAQAVGTGLNRRINLYTTLDELEIDASTDLEFLGLAPGVYKSPALQQSPHTRVPTWKTNEENRPTGSVWIKTTEPNNGARWRVRRFNSASETFVQVDAPLYGSTFEALFNLDRAGGGLNIPVNSLIVVHSTDEAEFELVRRAAAGRTVVRSVAVPGGQAGADLVFSISESAGFRTLSDAVEITVVLDGDSEILADRIATAINSKEELQFVEAAVVNGNEVEIFHKNGGDFLISLPAPDQNSLIKVLFGGQPNSYSNIQYQSWLISNWAPLSMVGFTASSNAPSQPPVDGQLWYNPEFSEVDLLVHNGDTWVGLNNDVNYADAEVIVAALRPELTSVQAAINNHIWISTADLENFPEIYRWNNEDQNWNLLDKTDQISEDGVLFADARYGTSGPTGNTAALISALRVSNFLDPDAPDPALFPRGMLLWNTRRSGGNVKRYADNYIDPLQDNPRFGAAPGESMDDYEVDRWVTASPNNEDGSGSFGRKAQRGVAVRALKSVVDTSQEIRDEERRNFNLIACPGYTELLSNLVNLNLDRGLTAFVVGDTPFRLPSDATSIIRWGTNENLVFDNSDDGIVTFDEFAAVFYPNGFTTDLSGANAVVPSSHMMLRTIALSDNVSFPWFAPAGTRRGGITNATAVGFIDSLSGEFQTVALNEGQRDVLYDLNVNPITFFTGVGLVNYGQKTRARNASALDRINVARLVVYLRSQLNKLARPYVFEPNDKITRDEIRQAVESLLLELVGLRALFDFAVVCDESNNTPARIDRNELYVDIAIEPVKAVEFIYIPLRVKNTGEI
jgi:hypothetical protein